MITFNIKQEISRSDISTEKVNTEGKAITTTKRMRYLFKIQKITRKFTIKELLYSVYSVFNSGLTPETFPDYSLQSSW